MSKQEKRIRTSKRNFIIALALLLLTNILMAMTLTTLAKKNLREQIDQRMLDIANTAAYMLNGDEIKLLEKEDEGTESYTRALDTLRAFQENIQLDYIYGIRKQPDGSFTFTIDPTVEDPGEFGSPIVTTDALVSASKGVAAVDKKSYTDKWGRFYSAYSPVFDSDGGIAGIVGVDFNANWLENKLSNHTVISIVILMAALTVGIVLAFVIMSQNRRRFAAMMKEIDQLDAATDKINDTILKTSIKKLDFLPQSESALLQTLADGEKNRQSSFDDEYEEVTSNLQAVCKKLDKYVKFVDSNMYKDNLTNTLNKAAYKNAIHALDADIKESNPLFSVAFFDLIGLNSINAHYGFEAGDELMFHSARLLKKVFGNDNIFRVAGDEFIAIMKDKGVLDMEDLFAELDKELKEFNSSKKVAHGLGISKGANTYKPEEHDSYRHVFMVARENMKKDKELYYESLKK